MEEKTVLQKTLIASDGAMEVVRRLLSDSWIKESPFVFQKNRNNYTIELNGKNHPLWEIKIVPKNEKFDEQDWKLKQDLRKIKNLGNSIEKKLYLSEKNEKEIKTLIQIMLERGFQLVYNKNYVVFIDNDKIKVFKIAAEMSLIPQEDGWYVGQKKII